MVKFRQKAYEWSLGLVEEGKTYEGIFLLLTTWNFANFRYSMKDFEIDAFQETFENLNFAYFDEVEFENIELDDPETEKRIDKIYRELSKFDGVKYVGASKIMHIVQPDVFVPWDTDIREYYDCGTSPDDYLQFLKKMQEKYKTNGFEKLTDAPTIPRAIDKYNLNNCKKS